MNAKSFHFSWLEDGWGIASSKYVTLRVDRLQMACGTGLAARVGERQDETRYSRLCEIVEETYQALTSDDPEAFARVRVGSQAISRAGRNVLNAEWARVKHRD